MKKKTVLKHPPVLFRAGAGPVEKALYIAEARIVRGWCQACEAEDKNGDPVAPDSPKAVAWCVVGALHDAPFEALKYVHVVAGVASWNDRDGTPPALTKESVLGVLA